MTETKHTRLPWKIHTIRKSHVYEVGASFEHVAKFDDVEDAAFAVRAHNSHDDLLAACEGALVMIRDEWEGTSHCDTYTKPLEAAIAKTKEAP